MTHVLERLRAARGFVFDMDGTLVLGDRRNKGLKPLPGALELTQRLSELQVPFAILTNGTTRTPQEYAGLLRDLGFPVRDEWMLTPAAIAADYLARRKLRRVMSLGGEGVWGPLAAAGIEVVPSSQRDPGAVDAVFIGWFRDFTMDDLEAACHAVWGGARMFAASLSPFFATAEGKALGTSRAIAAVITSMTGKHARVLGKPSAEALRCASRRLRLDAANLVVVGDDPALEVPMALRGGALAVAVHTGVGSAADFAALPEGARPHLVCDDVAALLALIK